MSSACYSQYCSQGCCNYYGYCPTVTGTYLQTQCYYYYYYWDWWLWYVIGAGIFLFLAIIGSIIGCCVRNRRRAQQSQNTVVIESNQNQPFNQNYDSETQYQYGNNYQQPQQPQYGMANNAAYELGNMNQQNQPYLGQPVYPEQPRY